MPRALRRESYCAMVRVGNHSWADHYHPALRPHSRESGNEGGLAVLQTHLVPHTSCDRNRIQPTAPQNNPRHHVC